MKAQDLPLTQLLQGAKQFIVPIFQRTYSWETKHCEQLFKDVMRVGGDPNQQAHFIGSVVYVADDDHSANIPRWQIIDGQQRLTTITLLLLAFARALKARPEMVSDISVEEVEEYYLTNRFGKDELKYKILLTQRDRGSLIDLLENKVVEETDASKNILENYTYFEELLADVDLQQVYTGFKKLMIVDVALFRGQDDPQMIFESLNSTGLDLSQSDLIRNFVLMRQSPDKQVRLYKEIWYPMEQLFGSLFGVDFDKFVRDYLTLQTQPPRPIRANDVYQEYKRYFLAQIEKGGTVEVILNDLHTFARYFVLYSLGRETDEELKEAFSHLRKLVDLAPPLIMGLYEQYVLGQLSKVDFIDVVSAAESYVFRRSICGMQTRNLGQIFSLLTYSIDEKNPAESVLVSFALFAKNRRFPSDLEFHESLQTRDIYEMRNCSFLLNRLENDSKEKIDTSKFTIEHVMPQNQNLCPEWQEMLGLEWENVHEIWLHRLGNLTLSGYNEKYSDAPFKKKKTMGKGFDESPLRLNKFIREQETWNQDLIELRGKKLADQALELWRPLKVNDEIVQRYRLEKKKNNLTYDDVDNLTGKLVDLYMMLRQRILELGGDTTEILEKKNITSYVYEYFAQIIPRADRLTVVLNVDFDEIEDESGYCMDATKRSFIMYSTVKGGVYFAIGNEADIEKAMPFIRLAYEKASN